jgi:hypothetical protein
MLSPLLGESRVIDSKLADPTEGIRGSRAVGGTDVLVKRGDE